MADPKHIGKYRIDDVLGKGAMGVVYKAFDPGIERGVIHRDTKRATLTLPEAGTLKGGDCGIAPFDPSSLTPLGMVMGPPSYMSPEQCRGLVVDRRTDLFSAGVVFYELVAGEKPFSGALETIAYKICHEDPRPASTVSRLALSPTIDALIATALEKNPDARFQNAKALSRALRQACEALADVTDDPLGATQLNMAGGGEETAAAAPPRGGNPLGPGRPPPLAPFRSQGG